ncbi:hypothetical protein BC941DRAFT_474126 [Chlamydoabsidia padenii]|nr:hypothetical protein BC941DRAFT_474126 [Chlamydoabsidia padenii]
MAQKGQPILQSHDKTWTLEEESKLQSMVNAGEDWYMVAENIGHSRSGPSTHCRRPSCGSPSNKWSRTLVRPKKDRVALGKEDLLYVREHEYPRYLEINIFDDSNNGSKVTRPRATCEILLRLATLIGPKLIPLAR